jgi:hypothetical protein
MSLGGQMTSPPVTDAEQFNERVVARRPWPSVTLTPVHGGERDAAVGQGGWGRRRTAPARTAKSLDTNTSDRKCKQQRRRR